MNDKEIQIAELSSQLTTAFEQLNACIRQQQLCKNQANKTEIVLSEVEKSKFKMFRSVGRMFVIADPVQLKKDLQSDLDKIKAEESRSADMQKTFEAKKILLTSQLNDLTPKQ